MNTLNLYAIDAEINYRQERLRGTIHRGARRRRRHERYDVVHPAGDARA
ncbi:MAG TPA: hypothetical protein VFU35_09305 [Jatrophihabitans sp.]|nr:hypothetical protein [Jatrophihabitans sp.]